MGRRRHGGQAGPRVGARVVRLVLVEEAARIGVVAFTAHHEEAAVDEGRGYATPRRRHRRATSPLARCWIVDLQVRRLLALEVRAEPAPGDVDLAAKRADRQVVSIRGQLGKLHPGIRCRVVDREVMAARRPAPGHIDLPVDDRRAPSASGCRHWGPLDPIADGGVELVDHVHVDLGQAGPGALELPADGIELAIRRGRHDVVHRNGDRRAVLPAARRAVEDLHDVPGDAPGWVAADGVDLAVELGHRLLGYADEQRRPEAPAIHLRQWLLDGLGRRAASGSSD
jgi:hypothetical protein